MTVRMNASSQRGHERRFSASAYVAAAMSAAITMKMMPSRAKLTWRGSEVRGVEGCASEALVDIQVTRRCGAHDMRREGRRWGLAVPASCLSLTLQIVAQRLLVEAGL